MSYYNNNIQVVSTDDEDDSSIENDLDDRGLIKPNKLRINPTAMRKAHSGARKSTDFRNNSNSIYDDDDNDSYYSKYENSSSKSSSFFSTNFIYKSIMFLTVLTIAMTIAFLLADLILNQNIKSNIDSTLNKITKCIDQLVPYNQNEKIFIGSLTGNKTDIIDAQNLKQLKLTHKNQTTNQGRPSWVSSQNQMWIPDTTQNKIDIYESLTMNLVYTIHTDQSTTHSPCLGPAITSYHPLAGSLSRGQVWISCTEGSSLSETGWAVYDPLTYTYIVFIPFPAVTFADFEVYDIAVGQYHTVVSLKNTSAVSNSNLIQFNNINFSPTIIDQQVGTWPLLSYMGKNDSALYVSSYYAQSVYKLNFTSLVIEHQWDNIVTAYGITTDPYENLLYVLDVDDDYIYIFETNGPNYAEISGSPITTNLSNPLQIITSMDGTKIFITNNSTNNMVSVYQSIYSTNIPTFIQNIPTESDSFYLTNNAINCVCNLCAYF